MTRLTPRGHFLVVDIKKERRRGGGQAYRETCSIRSKEPSPFHSTVPNPPLPSHSTVPPLLDSSPHPSPLLTLRYSPPCALDDGAHRESESTVGGHGVRGGVGMRGWGRSIDEPRQPISRQSAAEDVLPGSTGPRSCCSCCCWLAARHVVTVNCLAGLRGSYQARGREDR